MGKYQSSNRLVRRLIKTQTGQVVLKHDDPRINAITEEVSMKRKIPARELGRQYRHYCNRLIIALKDYQGGNESIKDTALRHHVCAKLLGDFSTQVA